MFPGWLKTAWQDLKWRPSPSKDPDYELLVLHAAGFAFLASILGAVLFEIRGLPVHVLMPLYLPSVIWLFGVARRSGFEPVHVKRFGNLAISIAIIAFIARMANLYVMDPVCQTCRWGVPYDTLAKELRVRGFDSGGTIVSLDHELSGNLIPLFPGTDVVTRYYPKFTPKDADWTRGRVAYLWPGSMSPKTAQQGLRFLLPKGIKAKDAEKLEVPWRSLWRETGYRTSSWYLLVVDKGRDNRIVNTGRKRRIGL